MRMRESVDGFVLTPDDLDTYQAIAAGGVAPRGRSTERLVALGLLTPDHHGDALSAADPRTAAQQLRTDTERELTRLVERMGQIPQIEQLATHFDPYRLYGGPGSEFLATRELMNARIGEVTAQASLEIYTAQPGGPKDRDPEIRRLGIDRTVGAVKRGVAVRSIYSTLTHEHEQTNAMVREIVDSGAEVRAYRNTFPRMVIVDQRHAFIDNYVVQGEADCGWHVVDRSAVAWAHAIFLMLWERAIRWDDLARTPAGVLTERQSAILQELAAGCSQDQVAERLGLAGRTVSKELADIRKQVGARTLYQVMAWWGRRNP
ncbi:LuxR C-terminal-related transcriptional regulator [Streptomyces sp. NPDC056987]|uniref:helix-turn-helix transcriptional regulator n=1 Tax=Streptomyces sp. NPDC056987 TaxID=3345988 RepID=UPI00362568C6